MAVLRDRPYGQFNFLVDLGTGTTDGPEAGFQECGALSMSVDVIEYRNGNDKENNPRKLTGLSRVSDVTLKRGIMGLTNFWQWVSVTRADPTHKRNVSIALMDEVGNPVLKWRLINARPMKWTGPTLAAKGASDAAMEELVLASEGIEMEEV